MACLRPWRGVAVPVRGQGSRHRTRSPARWCRAGVAGHGFRGGRELMVPRRQAGRRLDRRCLPRGRGIRCRTGANHRCRHRRVPDAHRAEPGGASAPATGLRHGRAADPGSVASVRRFPRFPRGASGRGRIRRLRDRRAPRARPHRVDRRAAARDGDRLRGAAADRHHDPRHPGHPSEHVLAQGLRRMGRGVGRRGLRRGLRTRRRLRGDA